VSVTAILTLDTAEDPIAWFRRIAKSGGARRVQMTVRPGSLADVALAVRLGWCEPGEIRVTAVGPAADPQTELARMGIPAPISQARVRWSGTQPVSGPTVDKGGRTRNPVRAHWIVDVDPLSHLWRVGARLEFSEWDGDPGEGYWYDGSPDEAAWALAPEEDAACSAWWAEEAFVLVRAVCARLGVPTPAGVAEAWESGWPLAAAPGALLDAIRGLSPETVEITLRGPLDAMAGVPLPGKPNIGDLGAQQVALSKVGRTPGWTGELHFLAEVDWTRGLEQGWGQGEAVEEDEDERWDVYGTDMEDVDVSLALRPDGAEVCVGVRGGIHDEGAEHVAELLGAELVETRGARVRWA
jgi:hypothetical protein